MKFNRSKGNVVYEFKELPNKGILFLYCSWSESKIYLDYLISILNDFPELDLYIVDIESDHYKRLSFEYKSHGKGETFWISEGKIKFKIYDYKKQKDEVLKNTIELTS